MTTNAVYQLETTTPLSASATFTGATRDAYGVGTQGAVSPWAFFVASIYADQSGTAYIDLSSDGTTWVIAAVLAVSPSTPATISAPVMAQFCRVRVVNGSTTQTTFAVRSGFAATGASLSAQAGVNATGSTLVAPWNTQVSRGLVPGASTVSIQGYTSSITAGNYYPMWEGGGYYVFPPSAIQMLLYSSSGSDTAVSILISGLDANYNNLSETLVLTNGTTGVTTVNSYLRFNGIQVTGTTNPVGAITLANAGKTVTYAQINTGSFNGSTISKGKSSMSIYTVPAGYTFYLYRVQAYCPPPTATDITLYRVYTQSSTGLTQIFLQAPFQGSGYDSTRISPRAYAAKTDVQWQLNVTTATQGSIQLEGILIANTAA